MTAAESPRSGDASNDAARELELALGSLAGEHDPVGMTRRAESGARPQEVGSWSLAYLGPGFHVQLRIARRDRGSRIEGFMSPVRPVTVVLTTLARDPQLLETAPNLNGRFEFRDPPTGPCRLAFVTADDERPFVTPPFWV